VEWTEFAIAAPATGADALAEALLPLAPGGVAIDPAIETLPGSETYRLPTDRASLVRAYLPADSQLPALRAAVLATVGGTPGARLVHERSTSDTDWTAVWKRGMRTQRCGRITVRPPWRLAHTRPGDIDIIMEPGMAFGTGDHPTTRACLLALQRAPVQGLVLDLGTGTGILAIAATHLGARGVLAVDTDPPAVQAAREHCDRNGAAAVFVQEGSLDSAAVRLLAPFDLVLANLTSALHQELAGGIVGVLAPGGRVIGAGIGAGALAAVRQAYRAAGATVIETRRSGQWRSLVAARG
jgi:ribosomal protein L11 methyltransferase